MSENREKHLRATLTPIVHDAMKRAQVRVQMPDLPDSRPFVDAIVRLFADALRDAERLDWLDKQCTAYTRPPMRMVTGSQWRVIDEGTGQNDVRAAIDAATLTTEQRSHA